MNINNFIESHYTHPLANSQLKKKNRVKDTRLKNGEGFNKYLKLC